MTLHLIKLAVGIDDAAHLCAVHQERARMHGRMFTRTRMLPRRGAEVLAGGSLYWVIKGATGLRQPVLGLEVQEDGEGRPFCDIVLGAPLAVEAHPRRPFQGWRYLKPEEAPPDLGPDGRVGQAEAGERAGVVEGSAVLPPTLAADLRRLGLL